MTGSTLPDVGIGGIFAILVIREVLNFLNSRSAKSNGATNGSVGNGNGNGSAKSVDPLTRSEIEARLSGVQYKDNCNEIVRRIDGAMTEFKVGVKAQQEATEVHYRQIHQMLTAIIRRDCGGNGRE